MLPMRRTSHICLRTRRSCSSTWNEVNENRYIDKIDVEFNYIDKGCCLETNLILKDANLLIATAPVEDEVRASYQSQ